MELVLRIWRFKRASEKFWQLMVESASGLKSRKFCGARTTGRLDFFQGDDKIFATAVFVKHGDKNGRNWSLER
jgi:hypothetical protein